MPHCNISRAVGGLVLWPWSVLRGLSGGEIEETQARPNRSFCEQLMEFEKDTLGSCSATLADFHHK